jgi:hypothetical protein
MFAKSSQRMFLAIVVLVLSPSLSLADERGLIWNPVKNSDRSYTTRIGARLPTDTPIRGGLEMGVNASKGGAIVDSPVRLWGNLTLLSENLPGVSMARDIGVLMNALTGSGSVTMTSSQKRIVTPELDVETNRNFTVRYDGSARQWGGVNVSQSLRLTRSETGTSFVLTGNSKDTFSEFSSDVALEQRLGDNITVTGTLRQGYEDHFRPAISARYKISW